MTNNAQHKIFELFTEHQLPEEVYYAVLRIVNEDHADSDKANHEINRLYNELNRKYENNQRAYKDAHDRFNSKMMSVYYLLDMVSSAGTHGEKRNVIMYLKLVIENLIHKGDPLPIDESMLPF
jgi:hypothetical protein